MIKRALVAAAAIALGVTLATNVPGATASPSQGTRATITSLVVAARPARRRLHWHRCRSATLRANRLRCAHLRVPLDYRHPHGRKITLALTMRKHTSSRRRYLGAVLVNPGGPGVSGRIYATVGGWVPHGVGNRFDWIGFDPRGVGASRPALRCTRSYFGYDRRDYVPRNATMTKRWRSAATRYAHSCGRSGTRRLLAHLSTADTAHDMNRIRLALHRRRISYYGFSYGSYLGQVFLTLYPHHVKRAVLDGVINPKRVWYRSNFDQDGPFDANMDAFWRWVAKGNHRYHLGTDWKAIRARYYKELTILRKRPAAGGRVGPDELTDVMLNAAYYVYDWAQDASAYAALVNEHAGARVLRRYRRANLGATNENAYASYLGVECTDHRWPGWREMMRHSRRTYARAPFITWMNTWFNAPCVNWPAKAHHRVRVRQRKGVRRFLLISETKDAATPYSGALEVRRLFPKARLIAGVGGTTHASSLEGVPCTDDRIAHYLATGRVPKRVGGTRADVACPPYSPPAPGSRAVAQDARRLAQRAVLRDLRAGRS